MLHPIFCDVPYIVIEGVKGSGKSTASKKLTNLLVDIPYIEINPTAKPTGFSLLEWIDDFLPLRTFNHWAELLYANRSNRSTKKAFQEYQRSLQNNTVPDFVLGDRSFLPAWLHDGKMYQERSYIVLSARENLEYLIPIPDIVLYLHAPMSIISQRIAKNTSSMVSMMNDLIKSTCPTIYMKIRDGVLPQFSHVQWKMIDADQAPELVAKTLCTENFGYFESESKKKENIRCRDQLVFVTPHESIMGVIDANLQYSFWNQEKHTELRFVVRYADEACWMLWCISRACGPNVVQHSVL